MLIGAKCLLFNLLQIFQERLVIGWVHTNGQCIQEYTYQSLQFSMRTSSNRRAHNDVLLS